MIQEANLQKDYPANEIIDTIYFGGGTPSLLSETEINLLLGTLQNLFPVSPEAEITLEANPDDITVTGLETWNKAGINRLSIGVQSFFEEDLQWMNRAHTAQQAMDQLTLARSLFDNITIDLIYGTPTLTDEKWAANMETALGLGIPHLSCYALTVEPKTPLHKLVQQHKKEDTDPDKQARHFLQLMDRMEKAGLEHYEISNFARPGYRSRHNSSYWKGNTYLGLGPSAHSYNGHTRQWNVANNNIYIQSLEKGELTWEKEELTAEQIFNEYIMISLRTMEGINLEKATQLLKNTGRSDYDLLKESGRYILSEKMVFENASLRLTREGKLLADGIAADLFLS